jgi:hypothetical protein
VDADATEPGVLVLNEMPITGWRANIDGKPAAVFPVNDIQTGLWLEAGPSFGRILFSPEGRPAGRNHVVVWPGRHGRVGRRRLEITNDTPRRRDGPFMIGNADGRGRERRVHAQTVRAGR